MCVNKERILPTFQIGNHELPRNTPSLLLAFHTKILMMQVWIISLLFVETVISRRIASYFLNKNQDLETLRCKSCPDVACVNTEKKNISIPNSITACYRAKPLTYDPASYSSRYSSVFGFGGSNHNVSDMGYGLFLSVYEKGIWLALKSKGDSELSWVQTATASLETFLYFY